MSEAMRVKAAEMARLASGVELSDGGEPVPKGSGVAAYRIAALLDGGMPIDEVLSDYPSLTRDQVEAARAYAEIHPYSGRPYPKVTVKRALRGAGLEGVGRPAGGRGARGRRR